MVSALNSSKQNNNSQSWRGFLCFWIDHRPLCSVSDSDLPVEVVKCQNIPASLQRTKKTFCLLWLFTKSQCNAELRSINRIVSCSLNETNSRHIGLLNCEQISLEKRSVFGVNLRSATDCHNVKFILLMSFLTLETFALPSVCTIQFNDSFVSNKLYPTWFRSSFALW